MRFHTRTEAGRILAKKTLLEEWKGARVLALPRGGVPVAAPLAERLGCALEVLLVRKVGAPFQPEFALGAVAEGGFVFWNEGAIRRESVEEAERAEVLGRERRKIEEQKRKFRSSRALDSVSGQAVLLVDDGAATGATMKAAIGAMKDQGAARIGVVLPVCAAETARELRALGAQVITELEPERLISVGMWYRDFTQVEDEEVLGLLKKFEPREADAPPEPVKKAPPASRMNLAKAIASRIHRLESEEDLAPLIAHLAPKSAVLLGESTHGTSEFYRLRGKISRRLIADAGFSFVAVEGDWPDIRKLDRILGSRRAGSARDVMKRFSRWPTWMWANSETAEYIENGRQHGDSAFLGLDVYSLFESMDCVLEYSRKVNPFLAKALRERYACFEPFERDEYAYARSLQRFPEGCTREVLESLERLLSEKILPGEDPEERFSAAQNARIVVNAEAYYRALLSSDASSWNVRDTHMLDTFLQIREREIGRGKSGKGIVWAHNTHIGDYRATNMLSEGYVNLGGLARKEFGRDAVGIVGLGTHTGTVTASHSWGGREQTFRIPPAPPGSWDAHFHEALKLRNWKSGFILFQDQDRGGPFAEVLGQRAIGVVYQPRHEGRLNQVPTSLSERYDAFIFVDETRALHSLHAGAESGKFPETWPGGV